MTRETTPAAGRARAPEIDPARCTCCGACVLACPRGAIVQARGSSCAKCVKYCSSMEVPCSQGAPSIAEALCNQCGDCLAACREGAIGWGKSSG